MSKTYLMRTFNLLRLLLLIFILNSLSIILIQNLLINKMDEDYLFLIQIIKVLDEILGILAIVSFTSLALFFITLIPELISRIFKDSIINLFKSILGTMKFRRFLLNYESNQNKGLEDSNAKTGEIINQFNKAVEKSVLDIRNDELHLLVKVPNSVPSQKIFKEYEEEIKEHVASLYPDYLISTFERYKLNLWLTGTKRK